MAVTFLLERYVNYLASQAEQRLGQVHFESQGPKEDAFHQLEYARLLLEGSQWVSESAFRNWLETGLRFRPKSGSSPAELADIWARDLYEWTRGGCLGEPLHWERFSHKIYCREDGSKGKFGIKIFPDSDIRELIEAHRRLCGAQNTANEVKNEAPSLKE